VKRRGTKEDGVRERVRAYLAALPPRTRREVRKIRTIIRTTAPGATDSFSYGIPAFRLDDRPLLYYAGWKNHSSIYPMTSGVRRALGAELKGYEMSKGTIRFPLSKPLPSALIMRLVKARLTELRGEKTRSRT
jgi:uncharacterized protein YdhG (YjbR/CyaY superfamily)